MTVWSRLIASMSRIGQSGAEPVLLGNTARVCPGAAPQWQAGHLYLGWRAAGVAGLLRTIRGDPYSLGAPRGCAVVVGEEDTHQALETCVGAPLAVGSHPAFLGAALEDLDVFDGAADERPHAHR
jgi:hypothetical protein